MAGRPRRQAMIAELQRRTRAEFDDTPDASPLDYVEFRICSGATLKDIADDITAATRPADLSDAQAAVGWSISGEMVRRYLEQECGADATDERLSRARARASYSVVDEAIAIADEAKEDAGAVAKARLRVSTRHWMAERYNPQAFGQSKGVSVNVSIASLHLDALRSRHQEVTVASKLSANNTLSAGVDSTQVLVIAPVSHTES